MAPRKIHEVASLVLAKMLQIGMIPHNMNQISFKFICVLYQFHRLTLPIMKIDRGQIQFREYASTGTEPIAESGKFGFWRKTSFIWHGLTSLYSFS